LLRGSYGETGELILAFIALLASITAAPANAGVISVGTIKLLSYQLIYNVRPFCEDLAGRNYNDPHPRTAATWGLGSEGGCMVIRYSAFGCRKPATV